MGSPFYYRAIFSERESTYVDSQYRFIRVNENSYSILKIPDYLGRVDASLSYWNGHLQHSTTSKKFEVKKFNSAKTALYALLMLKQIDRIQNQYPHVKIYYGVCGGNSVAEEIADYNDALSRYVMAYNANTTDKELRILKTKRY